MQQSIKQWFETIEDPKIRAKALANTSGKNLIKREKNLENSLSAAFIWEGSPEGHDFWSTFLKTIKKQ